MAYDANLIANIVARISGGGLGLSNFGVLLLLANNSDLKAGASAWAVSTVKEFNNADELLDYFEDTAEAYIAAQMYFSVTPKPLSMKVWLRDSGNNTVVEELALAADRTWFFWFDVTANQRPNKADLVTIQTWAGSTKKMFAATSTDDEILQSGVSDDAVSQMVGAGVRHSFIEYHPTNEYAGLQTAALFARVNYSADNSVISAFGKRKPGLTAMDLSQSAYSQLKLKGAAFYTKVEAGESIDNGRLLNPLSCSVFKETIGDVVNSEACVNAMVVACSNYTMDATTFVPQTPRGQQGAIDAVAQVCEQFYRNGYLGAREYTDLVTGETLIAEHGYVITTKAEDVFLLSGSDRSDHKLYPIGVRLFKAGTAFEINVTLDIE